ncbi:MAG: methyltransferase domain-containing protein [Saprospiraceae bacterium]|nr:methyltransferase domain-containing protein [Saprospiraceae bacterium]
MSDCVLCKTPFSQPLLIIKNDRRKYHVCSQCHLIQVEKSYYPLEDQARNRYLQHKDDAGSNGHRQHLWKAVSPSSSYINAKDECLDYGCGPVPVLSHILNQEASARCDNYDPYFGFTIPEKKQYDHVFCLETAEHFFNPMAEFENIYTRMRQGGYLTLMTERYTDLSFFGEWYYKRDFTHVVFFHEQTLLYLEKKFQFERVFDDTKRVTIFKKEIK